MEKAAGKEAAGHKAAGHEADGQEAAWKEAPWQETARQEVAGEEDFCDKGSEEANSQKFGENNNKFLKKATLGNIGKTINIVCGVEGCTAQPMRQQNLRRHTAQAHGFTIPISKGQITLGAFGFKRKKMMMRLRENQEKAFQRSSKE